jgi:hypothetical protein
MRPVRVSSTWHRAHAPEALSGCSGVFSGTDAIVYYLPGTAGRDTTFGGRPTAVWLPQARSSDTNFRVHTNLFGFDISWAPTRSSWWRSDAAVDQVRERKGSK